SPARIDSTIRTFSSGGNTGGLTMIDQTPSQGRTRKKQALPQSLTRDMSDLSFTVDGVELAPPWSWTPVFDFLWSMHGVLHYLERGEASTIGSNENAELIKFTPEAGTIRISSTYSTVTAICELTDLRDAWVAFRDAVLTDLGREHPQLAANPVLAELRL
ncbi:hypothetical protein, partial [Streptomyces sp. BE303]|uniref:hypothetical protein n=1 Tax=Streptomyces sp. BE303 TaxID=3002528 RepID=UPI002E75D144